MTITEIIKSLNDASFSVGEFEDLEIWTNNEKYVVLFDGSFDKKETYVIDATYFEPKEIGIEESKEITNVRLYTNEAYWEELNHEKITLRELGRLTEAIENIINVYF